ncbi:MAG: response regulator [Shinella sp.]|nr:response regulator [Shinella sp.]
MADPVRILVVEDEWLIAEDHAANLRRAGHHVVGPFASVKAALAAVESEEIDLALLDFELSDENSYPVAERLHQRGIPFAFLSGHTELHLPADMDGAHIIGKPIAPACLLATVDRLSGDR